MTNSNRSYSGKWTDKNRSLCLCWSFKAQSTTSSCRAGQLIVHCNRYFCGNRTESYIVTSHIVLTGQIVTSHIIITGQTVTDRIVVKGHIVVVNWTDSNMSH